MSKFFKYFEYAYIIFAVVFLVSAIFEYNTAPHRAYMLGAMAAVAFFMFFFKRKFRRRFEERSKKK